MLVVNQQAWTHTLETVITSMTEDPEALKKHWEFSCEELLRTVELVRTDINKNLRTSLGAMVVMDVHNRDTTEELAALQISDIGEFDWLAQLRCAYNAVSMFVLWQIILGARRHVGPVKPTSRVCQDSLSLALQANDCHLCVMRLAVWRTRAL